MLYDLDYGLFKMINDLSERFPAWNPLMKFLSEDGPYLFYLGVIVYWFTRDQRNRRMVAEAVVSACAALGAGGILSWLFYRNRPFVDHHVFQLIQHPANASFPSDHATGAFVIATAIWIYRKRMGTVWLAIGAGIAFSRVWVGVHYPTDIVAGALLGILSALAVHRLFGRVGALDRCLNGCMELYEKLESKLIPAWKKRSAESD